MTIQKPLNGERMATTNFNTSNQTFRKLMGNGLTYRVPMFQRDYSWEEEHWDDLWRDIVALTEPGGEQGHYMGYLVLQSADDRNFDIIDGQQRMTTLSLLVLAVLSSLNRLVELDVEADDNKRRVEELRKTYVGYLDPVTLVAKSKLALNRYNDQYYQNYLVPLAQLPKRNLKASEKLLRKAFEWFQKRVAERFGDARSGKELARFIDVVSDRLFFTVISVTDELNAFKVFETLNARGVRLSSTDLLKNFFFSIVHSAGGHENDIRTLEERWELMLGKLGSENVPGFLRVFWNSRNDITRQSELFKTIRGVVSDKAGVFAILRNMDEDADVYAALSDHNDTVWSKEQSRHIEELGMYGVRQPFSLLLAARRALSDSDFTRVLRACAIVSFRYTVIGSMLTSEQERVYNSIAVRLSNGAAKTAADVIQELRPIYLTDERFGVIFADKLIRTTSSRNRRIARHILFEIEHHATGRELDIASDKYTIEHILPERQDEAWENFTDEQAERCIYQIGNMTLLEAAINRDAGNKSYAEKKELYKQSGIEITKKVAEEHNEWTPERIASRQKWLAKQATAIWRLSELS